MTTSRATPYTRIAIACQGGGSHCAYTSGVLTALLQRTRADADRRLVLGERYEIVGLTGTSGGAISAYLAWTDLLRLQQNQPLQGPFAVERFWEAMKARPFEWPTYPPTDLLSNWMQLALAHLEGVVPMLAPTPNAVTALAQQALGRAIDAAARAGGELPHPVNDPWPPGTLDGEEPGDVALPVLMIGAANIDDAEFAPFLSTPDRGPRVEQMLASAALSELYPAVTVQTAVSGDALRKRAATASHSGPRPPPRFWDGLLSQNPPLGDLLSLPLHQRPQEIWIIRINPATLQGGRADPLARTRLKLSPAEIRDRRNELAGNLSLEQEKRFIRKINRLLSQTPALSRECQTVRVYGIALEGPWDLPEDPQARTADGRWCNPPLERPALLKRLDAASKLNRFPAFIDALANHGLRCGEFFLRHHPLDQQAFCRAQAVTLPAAPKAVTASAVRGPRAARPARPRAGALASR